MTVNDLKNKSVEEKLDLLTELENLTNFSEKELTLLKYLSEDENDEVRVRTAEILVFSASLESEKILIKLLSDKNELVRVNACDSLCVSSSEEVVNLLRERILKDKSSLVRAYAATSMAEIAVKINYNLEQLRLFIHQVLKKEKVDWVKNNYYYALYVLGDKSSLDILMRGLNSRQYRTRAAVVNMLSEILSTDNVSLIKPVLEERLNVENTGAVRKTIEKVLREIET